MCPGPAAGGRPAAFPERVYTQEEVERARRLIRAGHRHRLTVAGSPPFRAKVEEALSLIRTAQMYDFLRTYIREVAEVQGLSQLREADAAVWANSYAVADPLEAAGYLIQKAQQMRDYLEGRPYFGGAGEASAVKERIRFLEELKRKTDDHTIRRRCEEALRLWDESRFL